MSILNLRQWITESLKTQTVDWFDHDKFIAKIKLILPNELELVSPPPDNNKFNCFVYAFGLHTRPDFLREKGKELNILVDGPRVARLLLLLEKTENPKNGDYIFYSKQGGRVKQITHGGVVIGDDKIESKWSDGPIMRHGVLDVSSEYGDDVAYYKRKDPAEIEKLLRQIDEDSKSRHREAMEVLMEDLKDGI